MKCLHPYCPMGHGLDSWADVVASPQAKIQSKDQADLLLALAACGPLDSGLVAFPEGVVNRAPFQRLLRLCPCLYAQVPTKISARGVVHLCEVTLQQSIVSSNVYQAFQIQHPGAGTAPYRYPPAVSGAGGGDIMEAPCSEVLENHGVPHMDIDNHGWPQWSTKAHVSLNAGKMQPLKLYGDILVPCAPHNLLVSVKSEAARERFVVSGNRLESVGFGFFNDPSEFWTSSRMNLLKRWGFSAIYMPDNTLHAIDVHLAQKGTSSNAININGRPLFRSLSDFGGDIARIAGALSMAI